ncbi:MAG: substrate-binding domain-containing protein [Mucilaginibacter polytrichastri]|nr:substrate-binding domain-containing protein [Mucilaginibacter polytrichastri]
MPVCVLVAFFGKIVMNNIRHTPVAFTLLFVMTLASCSGKKKGEKSSAATDTYTEGKSQIWVEEGFKPIIDEQLEVFSASNPKASLKVNYGNENEIVADLLRTGGKTVILSRSLTDPEKQALKKIGFTPEILKIAEDAVALIVNSSDPDTAITTDKLKTLLKGSSADKKVVFENPNSGTVRFLKEFSASELKTSNIFALNSNKEVIRYISEHKDAIGIVSFNWLGAGDVSEYMKKVKVLSLCGEGKQKECVKPSQTSLALNQYPLSRAIYVVNASGRLGLGTGFATFLAGERGQRILLKSELLPAQIPSREIRIVTE